MPLLANATAWGMFFVGLLLMIVILLKNIYRYYGRRQQHDPHFQIPAKPSPSRVAQPLLDAPPQLLKWQVEMHDTARELKAELDSKMVALQVLIRQAREERERLEAALRRLEPTGSEPAPARDDSEGPPSS